MITGQIEIIFDSYLWTLLFCITFDDDLEPSPSHNYFSVLLQFDSGISKGAKMSLNKRKTSRDGRGGQCDSH